MSFGLGLLCYILGTIAVAVCLFAIPGRGGGEAPAEEPHGHAGH